MKIVNNMIPSKVVYNLIFNRSSGDIHNKVKEFSLIPDLKKQKAFSFDKFLKDNPFLDGDIKKNLDGTIYTREGTIYINSSPYEISTNDERKNFVDMINKDMEEYCKKQESHYCNICPGGPVMDPVDFHHEMWICPYCETIRNQTEFDWEYTRIDQHTYCSFKNIFKKNEYFYIVSHYARRN